MILSQNKTPQELTSSQSESICLFLSDTKNTVNDHHHLDYVFPFPGDPILRKISVTILVN
jgi:hypothetical protein